MLERVTLMFNVIAALAMILSGLYILIAFSDLFSETVRAVIIVGITTYSYKQLETCSRQGNKN